MSSVLYKHPYEKGKEDGIAEGMEKGMEKGERIMNFELKIWNGFE